jgi:hypothetical protein
MKAQKDHPRKKYHTLTDDQIKIKSNQIKTHRVKSKRKTK